MVRDRFGRKAGFVSRFDAGSEYCQDRAGQQGRGDREV